MPPYWGLYFRVLFTHVMTYIIPGLCRVWTRYKDSPADPYWVKMTYAPRDYRGCLVLKQLYEIRYPNREYLITADSDLLQPLA